MIHSYRVRYWYTVMDRCVQVMVEVLDDYNEPVASRYADRPSGDGPWHAANVAHELLADLVAQFGIAQRLLPLE